MNPPRDALHLIAYDRAYILPRASRQETGDPPRPPGRRRLARGAQLLALAVVTRPRLGQPLLCAGVARAVWSRRRYRIVGREMVQGTDLRTTDLDILRSSGVHLFPDALDFSRRRLIAGGDEAGMMLAGWDLPFLLSRFARTVRFGRDAASRHMTLDLTGSPWDPCVQITTWDGTRSRIMWTRSAGYRAREEDGHDVFPGLFLDLLQHAHMYSPERRAFAEAWLNSRPLTTADLRGKVVLVEFWTYTCINWLRTLPYVRAWAEKYKDQGLVVIGIGSVTHSGPPRVR